MPLSTWLPRAQPLLAPGREAEWAEINREKRDMSRDEPSGPDLDGVVADANAAGLSYVVIGGRSTRLAGLRSIFGFKRLAARPQDRRDLEKLEAFHGELPTDPIPGLDG